MKCAHAVYGYSLRTDGSEDCLEPDRRRLTAAMSEYWELGFWAETCKAHTCGSSCRAQALQVARIICRSGLVRVYPESLSYKSSTL